MSLLHPAILYGLGLAALPVILHFLLKQKPKKLLFPALRLIQHRRKQNVRRMRLRHLLLLLLRVVMIAALVFAVARPLVPAADYSLNLRETLTLVGILAAALTAYYGLAARWRAAAMPAHEVTSRKQRLRGASVVGAALLALLAVAWPYQRRIAAELRAPTPAGGATLPVAGVFLFDTSLSMGYQQEGKTRLDVARDVALAHLSDLPSGSRVAVADVGSDHPVLFQTTLAGAKLQLESRALRPLALPLNDRIRAALRLLEDDRRRTLSDQSPLPEEARKDRYLRRIYVFTDLSRSAWRIGSASRLASELERLEAVNVFVIDVGFASPPNTAIVDVEPSPPRVTIGGQEFVRAKVTGSGTGEGQNIELRLDDGTGRLIKMGQLPIPPGDDAPQSVEFGPLPIKSGPILHGEVRLVSSDPLPFDDVRYFTIQSRDPIRVLTIARPSADAGGDAQEWNTALEVQGYKTQIARPEELSRLELAEWDAICLINVPSLKDEDWYRLGEYVQRGGGLAVFLGSSDLDFAVNYAREAAQELLPGKPLAHTSEGLWFLRFANAQHPFARNLDKDDSLSVLEAADIYRFWRVAPNAGSTVTAEFTDKEQAPALLERLHGKGRVMMFMTAVDLKGYRLDWNILPSPSGPVWQFLAFADEMIRHLVRDSDVQLTYDAGEQPVLHLDAQDGERQFLLQQPGFRQSRLSLPAGETLLTIPDAAELGAYNLKAPSEPPVLVSGFSINPQPGESDFTRASVEELDEMLGKDRYQVVRSVGELKEETDRSVLGQELFPLVLAAAVLIFFAEHLMSNWFYDDERGAGASRTTWQPKSRESAASAMTAAP